MHDPLGRLLELRVLYRRNPEARAWVDRRLALIARAAAADEVELDALEAEVTRIADGPAFRFGPAATERSQ